MPDIKFEIVQKIRPALQNGQGLGQGAQPGLLERARTQI